MIKFAYEIVKDFGALGTGMVQLGVISYFGWKLFTNHLKHIQDQGIITGKQVVRLHDKLNKTNNEINKLSERVATIEGRCGAYHVSK